jgi:hypothetical protein
MYTSAVWAQFIYASLYRPRPIYIKKIMAVLEFEEQRNNVLKEKNED